MDKSIIWLGLDVHARTIAIARLDGGATTPTTTEIPNDPKIVRRTFGRLVKEGDVRCCYEAGRAVADPKKTRRAHQDGPPRCDEARATASGRRADAHLRSDFGPGGGA